MSMKTVNYKEKLITDFDTNDTIYISLLKSGMSTMYHCQFIKYENGMVYAKVLDLDRKYLSREIGTEIKARLFKCCLWDGRHYCWFTNKKEFAK